MLEKRSGTAQKAVSTSFVARHDGICLAAAAQISGVVLAVADGEFVRRQNRGLLLSALRRRGPLSRTQLAEATGLSPASITAIGSDLITQRILIEGALPSIKGPRGRPAIQVSLNKAAAHAVLVELDVNRARFSLSDYAGGLVDRTETPVGPELFTTTRPAAFLIERIEHLLGRNPQMRQTLALISISAQGILDPQRDGLKWSPIGHVKGHSIVGPVQHAFGTKTLLQKRGRLLAEGTRLLYPEWAERSIAAIFVGPTVAMGFSLPDRSTSAEAGSTEFGHMNHVDGGALCRCGMRGCIEAYAADYGVLRTAYGVPDKVAPAAAVPAAAFAELTSLGRSGRRNVVHAFNIAGRALGFGIARLLSVASPEQIVLSGPGASAYELMQREIDLALDQSLVCRINGKPQITVHHDEREPIFQGLLMSTLEQLDENVFAGQASEQRLAASR